MLTPISTKKDSYNNCVSYARKNSEENIRCTWKGEEIYTYTPEKEKKYDS